LAAAEVEYRPPDGIEEISFRMRRLTGGRELLSSACKEVIERRRLENKQNSSRDIIASNQGQKTCLRKVDHRGGNPPTVFAYLLVLAATVRRSGWSAGSWGDCDLSAAVLSG
jgi:hypothetical protein